MASSSSRSGAGEQLDLRYGIPPVCKCEKKAQIRTTEQSTKKNKGRLFYTCPLNKCEYFKWCNPEYAVWSPSGLPVTFPKNEDYNDDAEVVSRLSAGMSISPPRLFERCFNLTLREYEPYQPIPTEIIDRANIEPNVSVFSVHTCMGDFYLGVRTRNGRLIFDPNHWREFYNTHNLNRFCTVYFHATSSDLHYYANVLQYNGVARRNPLAPRINYEGF